MIPAKTVIDLFGEHGGRVEEDDEGQIWLHGIGRDGSELFHLVPTTMERGFAEWEIELAADEILDYALEHEGEGDADGARDCRCWSALLSELRDVEGDDREPDGGIFFLGDIPLHWIAD